MSGLSVARLELTPRLEIHPVTDPDLRRQAILRAREEVAKSLLHKDYSALIRRDQNTVNQWVYAAIGAYTRGVIETDVQTRLGRAYTAVESVCGPTDERISEIVGHAVGAFLLAERGISEPLPPGHPRRAELEPETRVS